MMRRIATILFFTTLLISALRGQDATTKLNPTTILIGDYIDLELRATLRPNQSVTFPPINDSSIGNFRVVRKLKNDTLYSGSSAMVSQKYIITCFEDSLQTFPSLTYHLGLGQSVTSPVIQVMVNTINVDSAKDVKPIKNVIQVPLSKKELASYLFLSFILLGLVLLIYYIYVKYIRKEELFDQEKSADPPHVVALKKLKEIENQNLPEKGHVKQYYDEISDTVRYYIEKRFGIQALEQTTPQILSSIRQLNLPEELVEDITEILNLSDLAKFAKETPSKEDNKTILKKAYELIQDTQMQYDANKKADALKVKKFYAQNKYGFKQVAINQDVFKILVYGLIATMILLSLTIILAYVIPINGLLAYIADMPMRFFTTFIVLGVIITAIVAFIVRQREMKFKLFFDFDSLTIRNGDNYRSINFTNLRQVSKDKKGNIILKDNTDKEYKIPKNIEYHDEVYERLQDIIEYESKKKQSDAIS